ncbi:hypothetical protein POSPLADRAFT_1104071, partial [Postia placenta MAD-698-R-SB12]
VLCFPLADGAEALGGETTVPSSCGEQCTPSGTCARATERAPSRGAEDAGHWSDRRCCFSAQRLDAGASGGVATLSAGSAAGCVKGAVVTGAIACRQRADRARRAGVRTWWVVLARGMLTAFAGTSANARNGNTRYCAPGQHPLWQCAPLRTR